MHLVHPSAACSIAVLRPISSWFVRERCSRPSQARLVMQYSSGMREPVGAIFLQTTSSRLSSGFGVAANVCACCSPADSTSDSPGAVAQAARQHRVRAKMDVPIAYTLESSWWSLGCPKYGSRSGCFVSPSNSAFSNRNEKSTHSWRLAANSSRASSTLQPSRRA